MSKQKNRIMKPVYFNLEDKKEREISEWLDEKFSSFGGLVKDLLYLQMQQERGLIKHIVKPQDTEYISSNEVNTDINDIDVSDIEC